MRTIFVNGRYTGHARTGMQYYAHEVSSRLAGPVRIVAPRKALTGARGHLWEQCFLPARSRNGVLWSPNNTGPLAASRHICTVHDIFPIDHPEWFSPNFSRWYRWLLPRLTVRVAHIIAVSEYTKSRLVERLRLRPDKITVVPNGVDARFRRPTPLAVQEARRLLSIPFERYLLAVGSLEPRKNIAAVLRAWPRIARAAPDLGLVIAGAKGRAGVFAPAETGEAPPNVHFTGYVPHEMLPALYGGAAALVFPTFGEGFGLPPLEAMAAGACVITSMNSALPEVVGDAALAIDPREPETIAAAAIELVRSRTLQDELRAKGFRRAAEFSWDRCAVATSCVLEAFA